MQSCKREEQQAEQTTHPPESVRVQDLFFVFYLVQQDTLLILKDFKNKVNTCLTAYIRWGNAHNVFLESQKKLIISLNLLIYVLNV